MLVDDFVKRLLDPKADVYGYESIAKTVCDSKATIVDSDWTEDRILGLLEIQELSRGCSDIVESSFIGAHHSAVENPKRRSPSLVMTTAATRDFEKEAMDRVPDPGSVSAQGTVGVESGPGGQFD